jgi:hypothetical protein
MFIEEGIKAGTDLKPGLLKGKSSRGGKYAIVPFRYDTRPAWNSSEKNDLIKEIRKVLKQENVPFKKLELDKNGKPKISEPGKPLHQFDIESKYPSKKANTQALKGLEIHQRLNKKGQVERHIVTFRTVSSGPASSGKWIQPGLTAKKYMDKAFKLAMEKWDSEIYPDILSKWSGK